MQIPVQVPRDLAQHPHPAHEAWGALVIEGYRSGALSAYQIPLPRGFETRYELDGFLEQPKVWGHSYTLEDFEKDVTGFERQARSSSPTPPR
jgi:hypothetical protein